MAGDLSVPRSVDLVCPICFDLGYIGSRLRGQIGDEAAANPRPPDKEEFSNITDPGGVDDGRSDLVDATEAVTEAIGVARRARSPIKRLTSIQEIPNNTESSTANPFVVSGPMQHKDHGRIAQVYTLPVDLKTVDQDVHDLLDGKEAADEEEFLLAFPKAELIRNMTIPFNYWLEQPCPAHHKGDNAPCVAVRQGLHNYLMKTSPDYTGYQDLLHKVGYVEQGNSSLSFRVWYPNLGPAQESEKAHGLLMDFCWMMSNEI